MTAADTHRFIPRRGLRRGEAATYVGVSETKFRAWIADGRMPSGVRIDGVTLWDIRALDRAMDALFETAVDPGAEW